MRPESSRRARPGLGTLVDIRVLGVSRVDELAAIDTAFELVEALEARLSAHRPDSELVRMCSQAHLMPVEPGTALGEVLAAALDLHRRSHGIFDVATAADGTSSADIERHVDGRVFFRRPLRLDLGGIAKGYVIDRVVGQLQQLGVQRGCVNAGGDLRVFGETSEPVALRFADGFRVVAQIADGAFAASRTGARPMSDSEQRHVDGRDGRSVQSEDSVAVFAETAMAADALTKIALVSPATMDELCVVYGAQWRRYPFRMRDAA